MVPLAHVVMDRMGRLPRPRPWVLLAAPAIALAVWALQTVVEMNPLRLVLPVMLVAILLVMRRLGQGRTVDLVSGPLGRHALFLIAPALIVVLAPMGWGTLEANWVVAGISSAVALGWLGLLGWRAVRG